MELLLLLLLLLLFGNLSGDSTFGSIFGKGHELLHFEHFSEVNNVDTLLPLFNKNERQKIVCDF